MEWEREKAHETLEEEDYDVEGAEPLALEAAESLEPDLDLAARGTLLLCRVGRKPSHVIFVGCFYLGVHGYL